MSIHTRRHQAVRYVATLASISSLMSLLLVPSACSERETESDSKSSGGAVATSSADGELPVMFAAPEFELTDQHGETFSSEKLVGHVWVADFIFTRCPGPCPLMTQNMKKVHDEFSDVEGLRFVTITVDPEHDTPDVLRKYARRFKADSQRWFFLTGERERIFDLSVGGFKLAASAAEDAGDPSHPIVHSQRYVLIDREGNIRGYYNGLETADLNKLRDDLRRLLNSEK